MNVISMYLLGPLRHDPLREIGSQVKQEDPGVPEKAAGETNLLIPKGLNRVHTGGLSGREIAEDNAHRSGKGKGC